MSDKNKGRSKTRKGLNQDKVYEAFNNLERWQDLKGRGLANKTLQNYFQKWKKLNPEKAAEHVAYWEQKKAEEKAAKEQEKAAKENLQPFGEPEGEDDGPPNPGGENRPRHKYVMTLSPPGPEAGVPKTETIPIENSDPKSPMDLPQGRYGERAGRHQEGNGESNPDGERSSPPGQSSKDDEKKRPPLDREPGDPTSGGPSPKTTEVVATGPDGNASYIRIQPTVLTIEFTPILKSAYEAAVNEWGYPQNTPIDDFIDDVMLLFFESYGITLAGYIVRGYPKESGNGHKPELNSDIAIIQTT